jgi:BirA family transcriptional regulator, biotin operon repressor / biotin---[acetyl-CoA-carboxylase] ligase
MPLAEIPVAAPLDAVLLRQLVSPRRLGGKLHYFSQIGSTNSHARELAENGAAEGEIVVAEAQTQGRGRLSRRWESPPFANLYLSVILRPHLPPRRAPQLTLTAAVSLAETVASFLPNPPAIKWPNDILIDGRKVAGILTEAACDAARIEYVILGIGLNVNYRRDAMPEELRERATSLADATGEYVPRERLFARLIHDLDRCYGELEEAGFESLRPRWKAYFGLRGRKVCVEHNGQRIFGRAIDIDSEGGLIVEDDRGESRTIVAGDVIPVES